MLKINTYLLLLVVSVCNLHAKEATFTDVEIEESFKSLITADKMMMDFGGVRMVEKPDGTKFLYAIAYTKNKDRMKQRVIAKSKAYRDLVAHLNGVKIEANKKLNKVKTITTDADGGVTYTIVKSIDETIVTEVKGQIKALPVVGTWKSSDGSMYYLAVGVVLNKAGKVVKNNKDK